MCIQHIIEMMNIQARIDATHIESIEKSLQDDELIHMKLVCVICNKVKINKKTKVFELFNIGFASDKLCYLSDVKLIILEFLN